MGEVPLLKQLHARYHDRGLELVGIPVDEDAQPVDRTVAEKGMSWPQLWDGKSDQGEIPKLYAVDDVPLLYLLDREGRLAGRFRSLAELERDLAEVLAAPPSAPREPRDQWQRPYTVADRVGIGPGSVVADVGAGEGYFALRLAARVGSEGKVYAVDIDEKALGKVRDGAQARGLPQVVPVLGETEDPKLPAAALDVALIADAYHEFRAHDAMLRALAAALKAGGRLAILETTDTLGRARSEYQERHRLPAEMLIEEAARHGLRLRSFEADFALPPGGGSHYLVVFEKARDR